MVATGRLGGTDGRVLAIAEGRLVLLPRGVSSDKIDVDRRGASYLSSMVETGTRLCGYSMDISPFCKLLNIGGVARPGGVGACRHCIF
jgi:hypothetical protein